MPTFMQCLEEFADTGSSIAIPEFEVEQMINRFGTRVRQMGRIAGVDGGLVIPTSVLRRAAAQLESHELVRALDELKNGELSNWLHDSSASVLIQRISESYDHYLRNTMDRYQATGDSEEAGRLRDQLVKEVFGS